MTQRWFLSGSVTRCNGSNYTRQQIREKQKGAKREVTAGYCCTRKTHLALKLSQDNEHLEVGPCPSPNY